MTFKLVTIQYEEQAQLVIKAETDEEARQHILKTFAHIPGLQMISIEDASDDMVNEVISNQYPDRSVN